VLDIGLPKVNGIEAARQIRQVSPSSKIVFLSQDNSLDPDELTLSTGAQGFVHKARAQSELLEAIESVLAGRQFASSGLKGREPNEKVNAEAPHRHEILFCSDDEVLLRGMTGFIGAALKIGHSAIVLATEPHREILLQRLRKEVDEDAAIRQGTYVSLDSAENPDPVRFSGSEQEFVEMQ
jgi:FixJ family two-component response regulator